MHIAVCIKQVPDVPNIRINRERMTIIREGVESIINPVDVVALEACLDLRKRRNGRITVLTMGPPHSEEALLEALAFGADQAILVSDPAFAGADTLATSHVLARALSLLNPFPDLVLCGRQTIDSDTGHVGPQIAEELGIPQVCGVNEIHLEAPFVVVKQVSDGVLNTLRVSMPALLTVSHDLVVPHHIKDLGLRPEEVGLAGSATRVWKLYKPPPKRKGEVISGTPQELVGHLMEKLEALSILDEETASE
jgi:electron transfer flavoprotein alpha/beta subunit